MNSFPNGTNGHSGGGSPGQLLTAGAGDCRIYVVDVERAGMLATTSSGAAGAAAAVGGHCPLRLKSTSAAIVRSLSGHTGTVYVLSVWAPGSLFVSGSADSTARLWDIRAPAPVLIIPSYSGAQGKRAITLNGDVYIHHGLHTLVCIVNRGIRTVSRGAIGSLLHLKGAYRLLLHGCGADRATPMASS